MKMQEIEMQKQYMEKVERINEGKNLKYYILTMGCKLNENDSEKIIGMLEKMGYSESKEINDAELYIINTCSVTNASDQKSRKMLRSACNKNKNAVVVSMGCYAQVNSKVIEDIDGVSIIIGNKDKNKIVDLVEEYIKDKNSLGKILLVDDNEKEISKIKKYLNKKGYDVSLVMYGEEVIKRIKDKEKYDYIIIDDELETMSGISLLKELNKEKDKSKKIVILDKDKLFISDHYIEDGFNDYIDRENLIKELDRLF